jgi:hypothetical protein
MSTKAESCTAEFDETSEVFVSFTCVSFLLTPNEYTSSKSLAGGRSSRCQNGPLFGGGDRVEGPPWPLSLKPPPGP